MDNEGFLGNQLARRNLNIYRRCTLVLSNEKPIKEIQERAKQRSMPNLKRGNIAPEVENSPPRGKSRDEIAALAQASSNTMMWGSFQTALVLTSIITIYCC